MDAAILERFRLPEPYRHHAAIARQANDDRAVRIDSVMPSVVRQANAFRARLRPRELHGFDLDDVLQELWLELMTKDHYYKPGRSKYITFALRLTRNKLGEIRNRWHTVAGPRDTPARLREAETTGGATAEKVRQTVRETGSLSAEPTELLDAGRGVEGEIGRDEDSKRARAELRAALGRLGATMPRHRAVIQLSYGIDRDEEMDAGQVARALGLTVAQAVNLKREAEAELERILTMLRGHEASGEA